VVGGWLFTAIGSLLLVGYLFTLIVGAENVAAGGLAFSRGALIIWTVVIAEVCLVAVVGALSALLTRRLKPTVRNLALLVWALDVIDFVLVAILSAPL